MSGYKRSTVVLDTEREKKLRLLSDISNAGRRLDWLAARITETLDATPPGIRDTFESEVREATDWLSSRVERMVGRYDVTADTGVLSAHLSSMNALMDKGHQVIRTLTTNFTEKADVLYNELSSRLIQLEGEYHGHRETLETWSGCETSGHFVASLSRARQILAKRQLSKLERLVQDVETALNLKVQEAQDLEHKHQKRLYVLKGLRQVCAKMGFDESEPVYERDGKRSRIVYEVDTLDRGRIRFFLSLDGISTESGVADDRCLDEFDTLSSYLRDEFGVKTKFEREGDTTNGKLIQKGEQDLPDSPHMEQAA